MTADTDSFITLQVLYWTPRYIPHKHGARCTAVLYTVGPFAPALSLLCILLPPSPRARFEGTVVVSLGLGLGLGFGQP